ncbi:hypothetical protein E2C01_031591 [Portunus trituberculatus]|uniref:Uncharacterized protein n=1 Tax=Portunus trituberculatus TaxID=210409 RepID=A0A5B7ETW0_PORTR|nr:hypothetical protein [Portunus trituberculatus]
MWGLKVVRRDVLEIIQGLVPLSAQMFTPQADRCRGSGAVRLRSLGIFLATQQVVVLHDSTNGQEGVYQCHPALLIM